MNEGVEYAVLSDLTKALMQRLENEVSSRTANLNLALNDPLASKRTIGTMAGEIWELKRALYASRFLTGNDQRAITDHRQQVPGACKELIDLIFGPVCKLDAVEIRTIFHFIPDDEDANYPEEPSDAAVVDETGDSKPGEAIPLSDANLPAAAVGYILDRVSADDKERFRPYFNRMADIIFDELSNEFGPDFTEFDGEIGENVDMRCRELLVRTHDLLHSDATEEED